MSVFLSYSSKDAGVVKTLAQGLEAAKRDVWFDHELMGGEVWWSSILDNIRNCSVFIFAVSDASLESKPCQSELDYATDLGRPVLPIRVGPVRSLRTSPLAERQIMDYDPDDAQSGFAVLAAVEESALRQVPLPDPLPPEPPIPYLYLLALRRRIDSKELSVEEQKDVVDELRRALGDETDASVRQDILTILEQLNRKPWTTKWTEKQIMALLHVFGPEAAGESGAAASSAASAPPGAPSAAPLAGPSAAEPDPREWFVDRLEQLHRQRVAAERATDPDPDPEPWQPAPDAAAQWRRAYEAAPAGSPAGGTTGQPGGVAGQPGVAGSAGLGGPFGGVTGQPTGAAGQPGVAGQPGGVAGSAGLGGPFGGVTGQPTGMTGQPTGMTGQAGMTGQGGVAGQPGAAAAAEPNFFAQQPRPAGGFPPVQAASPPNFWAMSIVSFLLSFLFGGIAMYFSYQVGQRYKAGDVEGARRASTNAKVWGIVGIVVGGLVLISVAGSV
jgi:hypothetical protein